MPPSSPPADEHREPDDSAVAPAADGASLLDAGRSVLVDHPALALVPLATGLLAVDNVRRVLAADGHQFGLKFTTPGAIMDLWSIVALPGTGVDGPTAVSLTLLPVFVVLRGLLAAGYLAGIRNALAGDDVGFLAGVRTHGLPLVGFQAIQVAVVLAVVPLASASMALALPATLLVLGFGYLFWAAPYVVVGAGVGLVDALRESLRLATGSRAYAGFFAAVLVGGTVVSVPASVVVVNAGLPGVLLGAVLAAPLAVVVNAAAMRLVDAIASPPTEPAGRPRGHAADGR